MASASDHPRAVVGLLNGLATLAADDVDGLLRLALPTLPWAQSLTLYISDYSEAMLVPMASTEQDTPQPVRPPFRQSAAGIAFSRQEPAADPAAGLVWLPVTNRWRRLGVLRLATTGSPSATDLLEAQGTAALLATVMDSASRATDVFGQAKRQESLRLTADMQWDLLPPMCIAGRGVTLAGRLDPAYEVGGDCFDYAINQGTAHVAIFDPLGHDLRSALLATLAVGAYRHARREAQPLEATSTSIDSAITAQFPYGSFVTGLVSQLDLSTGSLRIVNAGHLPPLLLRDGAVSTMELRPSRPWGLALPDVKASIATELLRPDDQVLLYTDGVVETDRRLTLREGIEQLALRWADVAQLGHSAPELLRRLLAGGADPEAYAPKNPDDATVVLIDWHGPGTGSQLGG